MCGIGAEYVCFTRSYCLHHKGRKYHLFLRMGKIGLLKRMYPYARLRGSIFRAQ